MTGNQILISAVLATEEKDLEPVSGSGLWLGTSLFRGRHFVGLVNSPERGHLGPVWGVNFLSWGLPGPGADSGLTSWWPANTGIDGGLVSRWLAGPGTDRRLANTGADWRLTKPNWREGSICGTGLAEGWSLGLELGAQDWGLADSMLNSWLPNDIFAMAQYLKMFRASNYTTVTCFILLWRSKRYLTHHLHYLVWMDHCLSVLVCIVLSSFVYQLCLLLWYPELFHQRRTHEHQGTTSADLFLTSFCSSMELLDILVKGALNFVHAVKRHMRGRHAGALALYISTCTDTRLHYLEYFYLICALCAIDWTNCSYWWGKTETFLHLPFCFSWKYGCVDRYQTLGCSWQAFNFSELSGKAKCGDITFLNRQWLVQQCDHGRNYPFRHLLKVKRGSNQKATENLRQGRHTQNRIQSPDSRVRFLYVTSRTMTACSKCGFIAVS